MAEAHTKHHDYHLVPPSPWPFIGSMSAFVMAVGLIMWMKAMPLAGLKLGPVLFFAGLIGVLYTMFGWWSDVIKEGQQGDHTRVVSLHLRYGMIMFIASEVMFFVAWFWAYFDASLFPGETHQYLRTELTGGHWPPKGIETFNPLHLPLLGTMVLLLSGTTVTAAHHYIVTGERQSAKMYLWFTVALGALFTTLQAYEYSHAHFGFSGHIYGATFFMATGFHGFHVIIGTIFLLICALRLYRDTHLTAEKHFGFEAAAWYWHFVDVVWLFLFACIYVWGYGWAGAAAGAATGAGGH
ncbi:MAG: cytochrome c oxidase subunit 3 [Rhizobiales bacterium]|nr:cytochrome c oxidase subunit 3 [Hyphomicrobiales bacterium]